MFFPNSIESLSREDLSEGLLPVDVSDPNNEVGYCIHTRQGVRTCCSSVVTQRILSVAFLALTIVSGIFKSKNNYTAGAWDNTEKRFSEGRYVSGTVLNACLGGFAAASAQFFAQSTCSKLTLYQIDSILLTTLPILLASLIQVELNVVNDDLTIKDPAKYEQLFTAMFSLCIAAIVTETFFKIRKTQEDERWDLTDMHALHHAWMGKKVRLLACAPKTLKGFNYECLGIGALGLGCLGAGLVSKYVESFNIKQFEVAGEEGQSYLFMLAAMYFTSGPAARYIYHRLTRAIKFHQKRVLDDPKFNPYTFGHGARLLLKDYSAGLAGFIWTSIFQYGANNLAARWFTFFLFNWEGAAESLRFISGSDPAFTIAPPGGKAVEEAMAATSPPTNLGCLKLRIPRTIQQLKGFGYRNFDHILKIAGGLFMIGGTAWLTVNAVDAASQYNEDNGSGVKLAGAITSAISLPAWFIAKKWIDYTHSNESGLMMNGMKYLTTYRPGILMMPGLLINQIYGKVSSHRENLEKNEWDYFWNVVATASLMAPYGLTAASTKQLNQSIIILLFLAMSQKWSKGDH